MVDSDELFVENVQDNKRENDRQDEKSMLTSKIAADSAQNTDANDERASHERVERLVL